MNKLTTNETYVMNYINMMQNDNNLFFNVDIEDLRAITNYYYKSDLSMKQIINNYFNK